MTPAAPPGPRPSADLPRPPRYGTAALSDLLPSVLAGLGVPGEPATLQLPPARRTVVLLVDGLGADQLTAAADDAPFLSAHVDPDRTLDAGFPSTTPISLTSLGTGLPPGGHGITGLFLRTDPAGPVLNTLHLPPDVDPRLLQPRPTAFERAAAAGVSVTRVSPRAFAGVGLSEYGLRGGHYSGADSVGERIAGVEAAVRQGDRSLVYVYWGDLDATGHRHGCGSLAWRRELTHVDRLVEAMARVLPAEATLLVTADHGMVDVGVDRRLDVVGCAALDDGVTALSGDPRALHVHATRGAADDVLRTWTEVLGDDAWVVAREVAIDAGWFGPRIEPEFHDRIGDVVAAMRGEAVVLDSRIMPPAVLAMVGVHGSLTPAEQRVPLLVVPAG